MQVLPKHEELFAPIGVYSSFYLKGNNLFMVGNTDKGSGEHAVFAKLNAETGKMEKVVTLEKKEISKKHPADAQATIWIDDAFVVIYLDSSGFMIIKKIETSMQKMSYDK